MFLYYRDAELDVRMISHWNMGRYRSEFDRSLASELRLEYRESGVWVLDLFPIEACIREHVTRVLDLGIYHQAVEPARIVDDHGPVKIFACCYRARD